LIFNRSWLDKLVRDPLISDGAKLTLIAAVLNGTDDDQIKITYKQLATLRNLSEERVSEQVLEATDRGWLFSKPGVPRVAGVLTEPKVEPKKPKRIVKIDQPNYEDAPVRKWGAKHFVSFFVDLMEERGEIMNLSRAMLGRRLMQDGVQKLRRYDRSSVNPNIRYRKYLIWAVRNKPFLGDRILRDKLAMETFTTENAPEFENSDKPQTLQQQLDGLAD